MTIIFGGLYYVIPGFKSVSTKAESRNSQKQLIIKMAI